MHTRKILIACAIMIGAGGAFHAQAGETTDPLAASFDRAWSHPVSKSPAPEGQDVQEDILYRMVNRKLQSAESAPARAATHSTTDPAAHSVQGGL